MKVNRSKIQATGLLLGTFVAGTVVGGAATAFAEWDFDSETDKRPGYIELLQGELNLTANQRALSEEFLSRYNDASHAIWNDIAPRYEEVRSNVRAEIMGVLDDDQQTVYSGMIARSDSLRAERRREAHGQK